MRKFITIVTAVIMLAGVNLLPARQLVFQDDFSGNFSTNWMWEGNPDGRVRVEGGRLRVTNRDEVVVWCKQHFVGDIEIEFLFEAENKAGWSQFMFHAEGLNEGLKNIFNWPSQLERDGGGEHYIRMMKNYMISYMSDKGNPATFRKNHIYHLFDSKPDPFNDTNPHFFVIRKEGDHITVKIDGVIFHDIYDDSFTSSVNKCMQNQTDKPADMVHPYPCSVNNVDLPHNSGWIGFRNGSGTVRNFEIDNVKVWSLGGSSASREGDVNIDTLSSYPYPFSSNTELKLPAIVRSGRQHQHMHIYNAKGNLVRTIHIGDANPGQVEDMKAMVPWDGRDGFGRPVPSGLYFFESGGRFNRTLFVR